MVGLAGGSSANRIYTSFKTGPGSHRLAKVLVFGEVEVLVNGEASSEIFDVRIYADNDGKPGSELIALTAGDGERPLAHSGGNPGIQIHQQEDAGTQDHVLGRRPEHNGVPPRG